ncbi:hypothetical protein [Mesorhizobium sp. 128a]
MAIDTIGKMLAMGHEADIHCLNTGCHHQSRLNLVALGHRVGFDHSCLVQDLARYFYCPKCRAAGRPYKRIGIIHRTLTADHCEWPRQREVRRQEVIRSRPE